VRQRKQHFFVSIALANLVEHADTAASTKWAGILRPVHGSAGVDMEVDVEREGREARVQW
jgi:hypothetical protein